MEEEYLPKFKSVLSLSLTRTHIHVSTAQHRIHNSKWELSCEELHIICRGEVPVTYLDRLTRQRGLSPVIAADKRNLTRVEKGRLAQRSAHVLRRPRRSWTPTCRWASLPALFHLATAHADPTMRTPALSGTQPLLRTAPRARSI
jgi:hypothetical protein